MKKAIPILTLLAYLAAIIVCIVNVITGAEVTPLSVIIFVAYVVGVFVLMFFFTRIFVLKKPEEKAEEAEAPAEEPTVVATEDSSEEIEAEPVAEEATEPVTEEAVVEATEEVTEEAEVVEAETEAAPTEAADDAGNNDNIVVPVVLDEETIAEKVAEENVDVSKFGKSRYVRSYESKLIQSDDELKGYYSIIKNAFMSYKKVTCSTSREHERVRRGRTTIAIIQVRGKTILLYLALDPGQFEGTMYTGDDVSSMTKYADTPFLYKVNGPRKAKRAARLIAMIAEKLEMEPTATPANEDYVAKLPYESTEALVEKGLILENASKK